MPPEFKFEPYTTFYKPQNAYWLARASQLAYTRQATDNPAPDSSQILKELKDWDPGFTEVTTFDNKSTQAFIAKHDGGGLFGSPGFVIIAFRGTDEKLDWEDNLKLSGVNFPGGRGSASIGEVHSGFYEAFLDVWEPQGAKDKDTLKVEKCTLEADAYVVKPDTCTMKELLERADYQRKPFWITGHSLGGALATICAFNFYYDDVPFYGVYTYGQPRTCKRDLKRHFDAEAKGRFFRFQNNNDIVSRIPQRLAGYSHVGTFLYIDTERNITSDVGAWFQFVDRVDGIGEFLMEQAEGGTFRDHDIKEYLVAMEKNILTVPRGL